MAAMDPRLERLLTMIPFIIKNQPVSLDELARAFGIGPKQVKKDLDLLWVCGTPDYYPDDLIDVLWEGDRVSLRMADYFFRPLRFTRQELAALRVTAEALQDLSALPGTASLKAALAKIAATLQDGSASQSVPIHLDQAPPRHLEVLRQAEAAHTQVQMEYYSWGRESLSERRLEPHSLFYALGNWYVYGWDHASCEERIFRVDRIRNLEDTGEAFSRPLETPDEQALFSFASGASVDVRLNFDASLGRWASEQDIYESVEILADGSALCRLKTDNLGWLEKELLRLGPHVTVIEPPGLHRSLEKRARRILDMYSRE